MSKEAIEYTDASTPTIVVKRKCGCYFATHVMDSDEITRLATSRGDSGIAEFLSEFDPSEISFEVKPVQFVRDGGLTFKCPHRKRA